VGPCITLAAGAGYTARLQKTDGVSVVFFGDGAVNNAAFHEGINMAATWQLPVLFVCENNLYATEVPFAKATRNPSVAGRAGTYGLPGVEVDGNDVVAVYHAAGEAVRRARSGGGPTLLECKTYRHRAHSEGQREAGYRTVEEINAWKARCPITLFKQRLLQDYGAAEADLEAIEAQVREIVQEAVRFAQQSPRPDPATAADHLYSQEESHHA
jgi:2-oxoisovalerate dehydrogenase E1 component